MDIKTHIRKKNVPKANKILRKGRGAWGDFVNGALEADDVVSDMQPTQPLASKDVPMRPSEDYEKTQKGKS